MAELEVQETDVTQLAVDAIVNAANTELQLGGGVAGAIRRAGGPSIQEECDRKRPIGLGEAAATGAGDMRARWVIHAATMEPGGGTSGDVIRRATRSTLAVADEVGAQSLGLVALGTGVAGFPVYEAARIMVDETHRYLDTAGSGVRRIVFAVHGAAARQAFQRAVAESAPDAAR